MSTQTSAGTPSVWQAPLLLSLSALSWAGNHVVARAIAGDVPPWTLNFFRWLVVAVIVGVVANGSLVRDWPVMRRHWLTLTLLGISGGGIFGTLQYVGLQYTTVVNMGVLNSVAPAMIALAGFVAFRDALSPIQMLGISVSLLGVVAIASRLDADVLRRMEFNRGDLIIFANMALFALYSVYLRKRPPIALASFLYALAMAAAAINLPFALYEQINAPGPAPFLKSVGAVAYAALFTSIVAYVCWSRGVEALGPARAGIFLHLIPAFNFAFGILLLGEPVGSHHAVGLALILMGVWLTSRR